MSRDELLKLISSKVADLMKKNSEQFNELQQIKTPLSTQIGVLATLEILQELGLLTLPKN